MPENPAPIPPIDVRARNRNTRLVILALAVLSILFGVIAFVRYRSSEIVLTKARLEMQTRGASLTPEQCVESVVDWAQHCEAMKTLCDASMPRMTETCLEATDRHDYCATVGKDHWMSSSFGYDECERLGVDRNAMKACALSYRAIATHCSNLEAPPS